MCAIRTAEHDGCRSTRCCVRAAARLSCAACSAAGAVTRVAATGYAASIPRRFNRFRRAHEHPQRPRVPRRRQDLSKAARRGEIELQLLIWQHFVRESAMLARGSRGVRGTSTQAPSPGLRSAAAEDSLQLGLAVGVFIEFHIGEAQERRAPAPDLVVSRVSHRRLDLGKRLA
jgi:hypothetical protein